MVKSILGPKLKVCNNRSLIDNLGTFALENITTYELIFVKGGHILTRQEMYSLRKIDGYWPIDDKYVLAAKNENEFPDVKLYINHSCSPNCGIRGDIVGIAMRDIDAGEEITFDYAFLDNEDNRFKCACGSDNCRHIITGYDWQIKEIQNRYKEYFVAYLKEKIEKGFYYQVFDNLKNDMKALRREVFVDELHFRLEDEFESDESKYIHCCLYEKNELVAYARVAIQNGKVRVGRVAVKKDKRRNGYGRQIMFWAETEALKRNINDVEIHALSSAVDFYKKLGYVVVGEEFMEDGKPHLLMTRHLELD